MRFLVTNDDSIESVFLHILVRALKAAGHEVYVAAPKTEQSWIGAAKSRSRAVEARAQDYGLGCPTWVIDGTPSDCVNIAMDHLLPADLHWDAVVSGINVGMNASLGFIIASGTVSAALEGALHGVPSVALSQNLSTELFTQVTQNKGHIDDTLRKTLELTASIAAKILPELARTTPAHSFQVHNLNFPNPCAADTPIKRTVPAHVVVPRLFTPADKEGCHRMSFRFGEDCSPSGLYTDRQALEEGVISHSILDYRRLGMIPSP